MESTGIRRDAFVDQAYALELKPCQLSGHLISNRRRFGFTVSGSTAPVCADIYVADCWPGITTELVL